MIGDEEAISPVIAVMLILVIITTFLAVYNTTYLPSLKEQAEIEHIGEVETSFLRFASSMENAASFKRDLQLKESLPLGGGDILLHPMKSGGSLEVVQDDRILEVTCNGSSFPVNLVQFSYLPAGNFWEDQGYLWRYGYVNVTKGDLKTPLQHCTMADVEASAQTSPGFARTLIEVEDRGGNACSEIHVTVVNFSAGEHRSISGNGAGTLILAAQAGTTSLHNISDTLTIRIERDLHLPLNRSILDKCRTALSDMDARCATVKNYTCTPGIGYDEVSVDLANTTVVVHPIEITVSAS